MLDDKLATARMGTFVVKYEHALSTGAEGKRNTRLQYSTRYILVYIIVQVQYFIYIQSAYYHHLSTQYFENITAAIVLQAAAM